MSVNHGKNHAIHVVAEKAALVSESIVKMLMTNETGRPLSSAPQRGKLEDYFRGESSQTLPTLASTCAASVAASTVSASARQSPAAYLMQTLGRMTQDGCAPRSIMALENRDLFYKCTPEQIGYYDNDALEAIHNNDIDTLRAWYAEGRPLQTSSPFGDTLLHIACRRGYLDVVAFLVKEASVSLWVQDEQGRTPLHFGCHSVEPWFDLVDFIIQQDPDLLFVADVRGSMPLDYAPRETWGDWIAFLNGKELRSVMPHRRVFFTGTERRVAPLHALPFLEDIDHIIADYIAQKKAKSKRLSNQNFDVTSSSQDGTSWRIRNMINSVVLENQQLYGGGSFSSPLSPMVLQNFKHLAHGALDTSERKIEAPTNGAMDTSLAFNSRSSTSTRLPHEVHRSSTMSKGRGDRIELLKLLKELRIRHIIASTNVEIALEMERGQDVQHRSEAATNDASQECDRLSEEILEVQKKLEQSMSSAYGNEESGLIAHRGSITRNQVAEEDLSMAGAGEAGQAKPLPTDDNCCAIASDRVEDESDTDGDTCPISYKDRSDLCLCKWLAASFESDDGLAAHYISCHCEGSGNNDCYLQLHLPISKAGWAQGASGVILGPPYKSCTAP